MSRPEALHRCAGIMHFFPGIPGRCQCGEHWWADGRTIPVGALAIDPDGTSPEAASAAERSGLRLVEGDG